MRGANRGGRLVPLQKASGCSALGELEVSRPTRAQLQAAGRSKDFPCRRGSVRRSSQPCSGRRGPTMPTVSPEPTSRSTPRWSLHRQSICSFGPPATRGTARAHPLSCPRCARMQCVATCTIALRETATTGRRSAPGLTLAGPRSGSRSMRDPPVVGSDSVTNHCDALLRVYQTPNSCIQDSCCSLSGVTHHAPPSRGTTCLINA